MACKVSHDQPGLEIMPVTTAHCTFTVDGKDVADPYRASPCLICYLHPEEELVFTISTRMTTPVLHPVCSVANCYFKKDNNEDHTPVTVTIECTSQVPPLEVLHRAKFIIEEKVKDFQDLCEQDGNDGIINVPNDRYTLSSLITYYLQSHADTEFAGCRCPHILNNVSEIMYRLVEKRTNSLRSIIADIRKEISKDLDAIVSDAKATTKKATQK
jgi:DNA-directed RNA polymerase subunit L